MSIKTIKTGIFTTLLGLGVLAGTMVVSGCEHRGYHYYSGSYYHHPGYYKTGHYPRYHHYKYKKYKHHKRYHRY